MFVMQFNGGPGSRSRNEKTPEARTAAGPAFRIFEAQTRLLG